MPLSLTYDVYEFNAQQVHGTGSDASKGKFNSKSFQYFILFCIAWFEMALSSSFYLLSSWMDLVRMMRPVSCLYCIFLSHVKHVPTYIHRITFQVKNLQNERPFANTKSHASACICVYICVYMYACVRGCVCVWKSIGINTINRFVYKYILPTVYHFIGAGGTYRDVQDSLIPSSTGRKARRISWDHWTPQPFNKYTTQACLA